VFPDGEVQQVTTGEEEGSLVGDVAQHDFVGEFWTF